MNNFIPPMNTSCFSLIWDGLYNEPYPILVMAAKDPSFEKFLEAKPTLDELYQHVKVGTNWRLFGKLLKLDEKRLDDIEKMDNNIEEKAMKMFQLWLCNNDNATRKEVIHTLKEEAIRGDNVADNYVKVLTELCDNTGEL